MHFFRKFLFLMVLTVIALLFTSQVFAEKILFSDDFEDNNDIGWIKIHENGPDYSSQWKVIEEANQNHMYGLRINSPQTIENSVIGDETWTDYMVEFDMLPRSGYDKGFVFRYTTASDEGDFNKWYEFHVSVTLAELKKIGYGWIVQPKTLNLNYGQKYRFRIIAIGTHIEILYKLSDAEQWIELFNCNDIDTEVPIFPNTPLTPPLLRGKIGIRESSGILYPSEVYYDNIVVTDLSKPKVNLLNIPFFSQIDPQWANDTYDSADKWAKPGFQGIKDYGCAITSAAMILNYQGFNTTPSGDAPTTPQTLNNYLKSINGGYSKNGFLIWPALTSYAKEAADKGNISPNAKLFQFSYGAYSKDALIEDLTASKAGILRIVTNPHDTTKTDDDDTHFVVYKGWDEDKNIYLADPLTLTDDNPKLEEAYNGKQYSKIGYFHDYIDPSYLWMYLNDPQGKMVIEKGDKALGPKEGVNRNDFTNSQFSLEKISAGDTDNSDPASWQYLIPNPEKGEYKLTLSTPTEQITPLEIFAFNNQAKEKVILPQLIVGPDNQRVITLSFDPSGNVIANITTESNFKTLKATVAYVFNQHKLPKNHLNLYLRMIESSEHMSHKFDWLAKGTLRGLDQQCSVLKRKQILSASEYVLIHDEITRVLEKYQRIKHK